MSQRLVPRAPKPRGLYWDWLIVGAALTTACSFGTRWLYNYPPVNWRVIVLTARMRDFINPPPETIPTRSGPVAAPPTFALDPGTATLVATQQANAIPTDGAPPRAGTDAPQLTPAPTLSALAPSGFYPTAPPLDTSDLPRQVELTGARWEPQLLNNCAPATLTEALTYWGWRGTESDEPTWYASGKDVRWQLDIASVVKPQGGKDYNVMAYELADYAIEYAGLNALVRYGGDVDALRRLAANGIPVIVERGFREAEHEQAGGGRQGHYGLITGYDDVAGAFLLQDTFMGANYRRSYDQINRDWRAFNYLYLVIFPDERAQMVTNLLGPNADEATNYANALAKAQAETQSTSTAEEQAFAWFNVGTSLTLLGRYEEAALAYDRARSFNLLPWRMLWYQTGPYRAYYQAGRYADVIALADSVLATVRIEESYYWRGWHDTRKMMPRAPRPIFAPRWQSIPAGIPRWKL